MIGRCRLGCCAAVLAAMTVAGCDEGPPQADAVRPVRAVRVGDLKAIAGREYPGRAQAKDEVDLSFQVAGPLITLPVDVGSTVKKGEVIAAVDPRDFQAAFASAQANLERARANLLAMERGARPEEIEQLKAALAQAEATNRQAVAEHDRNARLVTTGAVSRSDFDLSLSRVQRSTAEIKSAQEALNIGLKGARPEDLEAKQAEIRALEAAVANAKNQLDYTVLTAPFDGEVAARYVQNYQTVQAKQPIVRLLDLSRIEVTVQVAENVISLVPQVKQVECQFDAMPDRQFTGRVTKIGSEASQITRTFPVTVELEQPDDARILPGMAARIRYRPDKDGNTATAAALIVPAEAVFTDTSGEQSYVWIVDETAQTVSQRQIKTGGLTPVGLTIAEGISPGEWVVTSGVNSLSEGQRVRLFELAEAVTP